MATRVNKTALVTGASAGIGKAFAEQLAERGFDLVLTARRRDRLDALATELRAQHGVRVEVIAVDLALPDACKLLVEGVQEHGMHVDVLVNNAGYNLPVKFVLTKWEDQADFLQVLVTSVAELTHRLVPGMVERGYGRVINIASLAGLVPGAPGATLYAAAKSFLIKMSESLALELYGTGVCVTAVCPGFTISEFHDVNGTRDRVRNMSSMMLMDSPTVARQGLDAGLAGQVIYVNGTVNKLIATAMRLVPGSLARGVMRRHARNFRRVD